MVDKEWWDTPNDNPVDLDWEVRKSRHRVFMYKNRFEISQRLINEGKLEDYENHIDRWFSSDDLDEFIKTL